MSIGFKRASVALINNSGHLYFKNYSLLLKINPKLTNKYTNLTTKRSNTTENKPSSAKDSEPKGIPYKNLTIGVTRETYQNERRVAVTPAVTQTLTKKGFTVLIEENAGSLAKFPNDQYEASGAKITDAKTVYSSADIFLKVRAPGINVSKFFCFSKKK